MKNTKKWGAWLGAGAIALTGLVGCADRNDNGQPDDLATTGEVAQTVDNAANATENTVENAGDKMANAASKAGTKMEGVGDSMAVTSKVKAAIIANPALGSLTIDVDTDGTNNVVHLKGSVKSDAQKKLAESIAKKEAPTFKVTNELVVAK